MSVEQPATRPSKVDGPNVRLERMDGTQSDMREMGSLEDVLATFVADHADVPGAVAHIDTPDWQRSAAAGVRDAETRDPLRPDATFRIASVTKTYVAAAALRLWELGRVDLEAPIGTLIDPDLSTLLGQRRSSTIRLHHLLTHTSGLCDFVGDADYEQMVLADLDHQWSREEQLRLALDRCSDVGEPGERFHYSDTGYILLGNVLERVSGANLGASLRSLLRFEALGLRATYTELLETRPLRSPKRACQYAGEHNTYSAHPSMDLWGGGGLVSNAVEVASFFRALHVGDVFDSDPTLDRMLTSVAEEDGAEYGMGIGKRTIAACRVHGHGGHWGVFGGYLPEHDIALGVSVLQAEAIPEMGATLLPDLVAVATS